MKKDKSIIKESIVQLIKKGLSKKEASEKAGVSRNWIYRNLTPIEMAQMDYLSKLNSKGTSRGKRISIMQKNK